MGDATFIQQVYEIRSELVYFFLIKNGKFYLMDESKKVRVLVQDPLNK